MKRQARNKRELTIAVLEQLDCESVGAVELQTIQDSLREVFGDGAVDSPAAIARVLADEGANLRHPEILECDVRWRLQQVSSDEFDFGNLDVTADRLTRLAEQSEEMDSTEEVRLREQIDSWLREAELLSSSKVISESEKAMAQEIRSWLGIWLQNPQIFSDWLSLRLRAPEFLEKFGGRS
jgi:hypothetical protein